MKTVTYKRRYHHLIPILCFSNMLSEEEKACIPRSTRNRWNHLSHEDYFGYEMVKDYIDDFNHIKNYSSNMLIELLMR